MKLRLAQPLLLLLVLAGCGNPAPPPASTRATDSQGGDSMPMGGMTMRGTALIPELRRYLDSLAGLPPSAIPEMLGSHERRLAPALDAFGADMTGMGMSADAAWAALTDSIKTDLADVPAVSGAAQTARFVAHIGRVRRLLERHQAMMKGM